MKENDLIQQVKGAATAEEVFERVLEIGVSDLTSRERSAIARRLKALGHDKRVKIALLSNFTLDFLETELQAVLAGLRLGCDCYVAPINQYYQESLATDGELQSFDPELIVLALTLRELVPDAHFRLSEFDQTGRQALAKEIIEHVTGWVSVTRKNFSSNVLVANFIPPCTPHLGVSDFQEDETEHEFYHQLNKDLRKALLEFDQVYVLDVAGMASKVGWDSIYDPRMYYVAKILWSNEFCFEISKGISKSIVATRGMAKKCLVLDLDNTLWGGVLGEDGVHGVKIGTGDPISEAYLDFQHRIKSLKTRGILLAVCSKNNQSDVEEAFQARTDMPLALNDFSALKINWENKHSNIIDIARELNIGLDSLVFIDDNPAEISLIRQMLPEVVSILLPGDHENIPGIIEPLPYFEKLYVLSDDRSKSEQYAQNKVRTEFQSQSTDLDSYLNSLETKVTLRAVDDSDLPRVLQLFTKTNQFNVTTIRYTLGEIKEILASADYDLWCYSVKDKFGDLGTVGLLLVSISSDGAAIDSFIMSCRSMGRSVETSVVNWAKEYYLVEKQLPEIRAKFVATKKNKPVETLYDKQGFSVVSKSGSEAAYQLDSKQFEKMNCDWIEFQFSG